MAKLSSSVNFLSLFTFVNVSMVLSLVFSLLALYCSLAFYPAYQNASVDLSNCDSVHGQPPPSKTSPAVEDLYRTWSSMYRLDKENPHKEIRPKKNWIKGSEYPLAPHLQDCEYVTKVRKELDSWGPNNEPPAWLNPREPLKDADPPWVSGSNSGSWSMTRYIQSYLWKHQNPQNCSDPNLKFAIFEWAKMSEHGLGSTLHVFAQAMAEGIGQNRIVIPAFGTFERATHSSCRGTANLSLDCFFFPLVKQECVKIAYQILDEQSDEEQHEALSANERLSLNTRVIYVRRKTWGPHSWWYPKGMEERWLDDPVTIEHLGSTLKFKNDFQEYDSEGQPTNVLSRPFAAASWARGQMIRYMLRFPTATLCHAVNKVRHENYGMEVAKEVVETVKGMELSESVSEKFRKEEKKLLQNIDFSKRPLEKTIWRTSEPYIPRPIISIHVRLSDKGAEMKLFSFGAHMWMAERIRRHVPNARHIWLSTESQSVIDETSLFDRWKFYFSNSSRVSPEANTRSHPESEFEGKKELGILTLLTFANLEISHKCDYFVGTLGSNMARLINELRLTNGQAKSGFIALNFNEY